MCWLTGVSRTWWWLARLGKLYDVHFVSGLDPAFVQRCGFHPVSPDDHLARLEKLARPGARVAVLPYSGFTLPFVSDMVASGSR